MADLGADVLEIGPGPGLTTDNPIDPDGLTVRLTDAGFTDVTVRTNPDSWAAHARVPS